MKIFSALAALCVTIVCLSSFAYAQSLPPVTQAAVQSQPKADVSRDTREQVLEAELKVLKEFTQHILTTVYFSLGAVVVVLVAMLGFGWYQHARVAEHEKEALRRGLASALSEGLARGIAELERKLTDQVLEVDRKFAGALELALRRQTELRLAIAADIFRASHAGKTPLTDLEVLIHVIHGSVDKAAPEALKHALSVLTEHLETRGGVGTHSRTSLMELVNALPSECGGYRERIRELLAK